MKINLDSEPIDLTCPSCSKKFTEKIGRLKKDPVIACPHCKAPTRIDAHKLRRAIESIQKSADALGKNLGKIFK